MVRKPCIPVNQSELGGYKQQLTFLHASINKKQVEQVLCAIRIWRWGHLGNKKVVLYSLDCPFHLLARDRQTDRQLSKLKTLLVDWVPDVLYIFCCCYSCRGFLRGQDQELPEIVAFQENYREGALLAVVCRVLLILPSRVVLTMVPQNPHHINTPACTKL